MQFRMWETTYYPAFSIEHHLQNREIPEMSISY